MMNADRGISGSFWYKSAPKSSTEGYDSGKVKRLWGVLRGFWDHCHDVTMRWADADFITGGWVAGKTHCEENPGSSKECPIHYRRKLQFEKTMQAWDIQMGDGTLEIVAQTLAKTTGAYYQKTSSRRIFKKMPLGRRKVMVWVSADVNGDGRVSLIISDGWLEAPEILETGNGFIISRCSSWRCGASRLRS